MKIKMLNESEDLVIDAVKDSEFNKIYGGILYKGVHSPKTAMFPFKERSMPRDTWAPYHVTINKFAYEKFGINVRNLLFVSTKYSQASTYGAVVRIFPVGHYRMFYAEGYDDMTNCLYAFTSDAYRKFFFFIKNTLTKYLSLRSGELDHLVDSDKGNFVHGLVIKTSRGNFDMPEAIAFIKENLKEKVKEKLIELDKYDEKFDKKFDKLYDKFYKTEFEEPINNYVSSLVEVKKSSQLLNYEGEVMLYSPDGIYAITENDYVWEINL